MTGQREREQRLEALNEMTRDLMTADTREEIAEIGVEAARDILDLEANAIHLYEDGIGLVPVAATDAVTDLVGDPPTLRDGDSIGWRVYERGEPLAVDDVLDDPDIYNPDTSVRSELLLPIGNAGILIAGSPTPEAFDQEDVVLGEILAGNVATALEQVQRTEELRDREAELTRQNDRLDEFASVVSHDLRNPLNVAKGRLELGREEADSEHFDDVERAHERMDTLIDDLLTLARDGRRVSETETVSLGDLARSCWRSVPTDDATIRINTDRQIRGDRSRLQQLLENLMRNAVEHGSTSPQSQTPEDTVEHDSTSPQSQTPEDTVESGGETVTVTLGGLDDGFYVEDDGPGIPADDRETVFDTGYSTATDGTGFGLSIVKGIVDAHDWTITVTESDEGGARFEITGVEFVD